MAVAGLFGAAEGQVNFRADGRSVHVGDAGVEIARGHEGFINIARIDGRGEPVLHAIGNFQGIFKAVTGNHRHHGAEDFFLGDAHFRMDISKDCRLVEPSLIVFRAGQAVAAVEKLGAFVLADLHIFLHRLKLLLVDHRSHVGAFVQSVSHFELTHTV